VGPNGDVENRTRDERRGNSIGSDGGGVSGRGGSGRLGGGDSGEYGVLEGLRSIEALGYLPLALGDIYGIS
jgi:hypothetical protein